MSGFRYRDGVLHADAVPLDRLAAEVGTPAYVYAATAMRAAFAELTAALAPLPALVCYAVKANSNLAILRLFAAMGAGADTVSGGEIERALAAGVPPRRIVYAGVGKTDAELARAVAAGVLQINAESVEELERLAAVGRAVGRDVPVAIRVNPEIAAGGHDKISTARPGDKFGVPLAEIDAAFARAQALEGVAPVGLHLHIGSQIRDLAAFEAAYRRGVELVAAQRARGRNLRRLDLGGGLGVRDGDLERPSLAAYAAMLRRVVAGLDVELVLEPGRCLVAEAGVLLASVIQPKVTAERRFLILDAGMNNLVRPAMYGAWHDVVPVRQPEAGTSLEPWDVVGPICESSDILGRRRELPPLGAGDLVAIATAGAYGAVMASPYNSRPGAAEILVDGERWAIVKPRRPPAEQFADEVMPAWLGRPEGDGTPAGDVESARGGG